MSVSVKSNRYTALIKEINKSLLFKRIQNDFAHGFVFRIGDETVFLEPVPPGVERFHTQRPRQWFCGAGVILICATQSKRHGSAGFVCLHFVVRHFSLMMIG